MNLEDFFEEHEDEFLKFERVTNRLANRPDLHAFLLLDKLVPGTGDIVGSASHDEIYLSVGWEELQKVATTEDLIDLHRCGVLFDSDSDGLFMFA